MVVVTTFYALINVGPLDTWAPLAVDMTTNDSHVGPSMTSALVHKQVPQVRCVAST